MAKAVRNIISIRDKKIVDESKDITIIIPAAGENGHMKSQGPKSLLKIGGISIIDRQISLIRERFPRATIILISGYESAKVMNNAPENIIHIENERYNTTHISRSIAIGLRATITKRVLVIYGDLIFNANALRYNLEDKSLLFVDDSGLMSETEIGCVSINNILEHLVYDMPVKWAQITYFVGNELKLLKELTTNIANEKLLGFEIINEIINRGGKFLIASPENTKVNDIDCSKDIEIAEKII